MRELPQDDVSPYNGTVRPGEKCTLPRAADYSFLAGEDCAQRADHKTAVGGVVECDLHLDGRTGSRCAALPRAWHVSPLVRLEAHIPLFEKCDQLMSGFLFDLGPYGPPFDANDDFAVFSRVRRAVRATSISSAASHSVPSDMPSPYLKI